MGLQNKCEIYYLHVVLQKTPKYTMHISLNSDECLK